jgi:2-haloacid dehalogenase
VNRERKSSVRQTPRPTYGSGTPRKVDSVTDLPYLSRRRFLVSTAAGFLIAEKSIQGRANRVRPAQFNDVKALVFDTFGTVVDWRTSVSGQVEKFAKRKNLQIDALKFADAWRSGYQPAMNSVRSGKRPWTNLDGLHRIILDDVIKQFDPTGQVTDSELAQLSRSWHYLRPWPDSVSGLTRLKRQFIIAPLSNGNIALMTDLAKFAGLPWDCILGAELVRHYKPDREVYESAAVFLDLRADQVMMVAAHLSDMTAAKQAGLRTAFVVRPTEFGPTGESLAGKADLQPNEFVDLSVKDFNELATKLGA